MLAMIVQCQS